MSRSAEDTFHRVMVDIYLRAKTECHYNAERFMQMVAQFGGPETARKLLASDGVQYGFSQLWQCGRLDLTVEAHVLKPEFAPLFTPDERKRAEERLTAHGFKSEHSARL